MHPLVLLQDQWMRRFGCIGRRLRSQATVPQGCERCQNRDNAHRSENPMLHSNPPCEKSARRNGLIPFICMFESEEYVTMARDVQWGPQRGLARCPYRS